MTTPTDAAQATPPTIADVAEIIVTALNLDMTPNEIDADAPLFGDGLGLDSIDILEIALVISKRYGIQLRADNEDNATIFRSLRNLTDYIVRQMQAGPVANRRSSPCCFPAWRWPVTTDSPITSAPSPTPPTGR